jgi:hypothetical protein
MPALLLAAAAIASEPGTSQVAHKRPEFRPHTGLGLERSSMYLSNSVVNSGGTWEFGRIPIPIGLQLSSPTITPGKFGFAYWGDLTVSFVNKGRFNDLHSISSENGFNGQTFKKKALSGLVGLEVQLPLLNGNWTPRIQLGGGWEVARIDSTYTMVTNDGLPLQSEELEYKGHWRGIVGHLGTTLPIWNGLGMRIAGQRTNGGEVYDEDVVGTREDQDDVAPLDGWPLEHYRWLIDFGFRL